VYLSNGASNDVAVLDSGSGKLVKRIAAGSSPRGVAIRALIE